MKQSYDGLDWGMPIPAESVRRLACDASVTPVLVDADHNPLNVGRTTRTIPAAIRRALALRDGGCRFPGCDRPADWTEGHHLKFWAFGGETNLHNLGQWDQHEPCPNPQPYCLIPPSQARS